MANLIEFTLVVLVENRTGFLSSIHSAN